MKSRLLGTVDEGKNPQAKTGTGETRLGAGARVIPSSFWAAANSEIGGARKKQNSPTHAGVLLPGWTKNLLAWGRFDRGTTEGLHGLSRGGTPIGI